MKNVMRSFIFLIGVVALVVAPQSCLKEYSDLDKISKTVDYSPSVAAAVAHTKLTARDIIRDYDKDELFEEGNGGFLYLMYDKKVFSETADELISISNQEFPTMDFYTNTVYDAITPSAGNRHFPSIPVPNLFYVSNQEQLDSIKFDALDINIKVSSSFHLSGVLKVTFPTLRKNGVALVTTMYPDATGNYYNDYLTHVEDYTLVLSEDSVIIQYDLTLQDGAANSGEQIDVDIELQNLDFDAIYGYVGRISTPIPQDTVNLSIFDNAFEGAVWFKDPSIKLDISNSFGLPIRNYFGDLQTYSNVEDDDPDSGTWMIHDDFPIDILSINYPSVMGQTAYQQEYLNTDNFPTISDVVSSNPKYLFFEVDSVVINPDGYNQSSINFVCDTSKVSVNMEVKLPLEGNAWYSLVDTIDLDIEENFEDISKHFVEANLRVIFNSMLPTNAYLQVIFTDTLYNEISVLYDDENGERVIPSAVLNSEGRAIQEEQQITNIVFGNGSSYDRDINDLELVKKAIVIARLKTGDVFDSGSDLPVSRFYADNYLEIKFGVKGQGKYEESLD